MWCGQGCRVHGSTELFFLPTSDAASRRALQLALQQLAESQPDATAKNLLHSLQSSGISGKAGAPRCAALRVEALLNCWCFQNGC